MAQSQMQSDARVIAVTGAAGFIGRNLVVFLRELGHDVREITRDSHRHAIEAAVAAADVIVHLACAIRPPDPDEFSRSRAFTKFLAEQIARAGRRPLVIYSSSRRAIEATDFGLCARACEDELFQLSARGEATVAVYRLPNVFGKWARPNYNSCIATFCHDLARGRPIRIDEPARPLSLLYVDDLLSQWCALIDCWPQASGYFEAEHIYNTSVGAAAAMLSAIAEGRPSAQVEDVSSGLPRALYATFIAALPAEAFSYPLAARTDPRGSFSEVFKTRQAGQVSVLTAEPGMTRGGHYHHTKVEKFLVVHGHARFRFRHILNGERFELTTSGDRPVVVETIPGWTHDITNVGNDVMVSMLWASEAFDETRPDTVTMPL